MEKAIYLVMQGTILNKLLAIEKEAKAILIKIFLLLIQGFVMLRYSFDFLEK